MFVNSNKIQALFLSKHSKDKSESEATQSCPTLCDPMETARLFHAWNFPGKSTGVVAISFSRRSC